MKKIWTLVISLLMVIMMGACGGSTPTSSGPSSSSSTTDNPAKEQVLWDSENVKVSFVEIFEIDYIEDTCYVRLKVENKSGKTITVYPKDTYVNDTSILFRSGMFMQLLPDKQSQTPFYFSYNNLGITSKDEIKKIEFKIWIKDENHDTIEETETLVVTFP